MTEKSIPLRACVLGAQLRFVRQLPPAERHDSCSTADKLPNGYQSALVVVTVAAVKGDGPKENDDHGRAAAGNDFWHFGQINTLKPPSGGPRSADVSLYSQPLQVTSRSRITRSSGLNDMIIVMPELLGTTPAIDARH